jgi:hypothetical protein|uniref:hypothetical protein n=1 Tax=Cephaloticoccus sp. TaxID=1985742 RepID=UPI00404B1139
MNSKTRLAIRCLTLLTVAAAALPLSTPASEPGADGFYFPSTGVYVEGQALLLAIDDQLLPLRENMVDYLSKPTVRTEPVLAASKDDPLAPDQVAAHFYGAVLHDSGKFRMWYYAVGLSEPGDARRADLKKLTQGPVCYAESDDGIHWTKPVLNQLEFKGSRSNNAVALPETLIEGVHVIKDESDPDPARRYKMVYNAHNGQTWVFRTALSADAITWKPAPEFAIQNFLETASFYKFNGLYVVQGQRLLFSEGGNPSGRQGRGVISTNFDRWLPGDTQGFFLPEPADPADRGQTKPYDQVHLGVGAASYGSVCVGLYGIWHNMIGDESSQKQWGWFGYGKISCDLGLVISNDGMRFREPVKGHAYISRFDAPATPAPGKEYPTILAQSGNGILNVGDETRIYFGRWLNAEYGQGYDGEVALATLPRDRWGAVGLFPAPQTQDPNFRGIPRVYNGPVPNQGFVWSAPITLPVTGCEVLLNADAASHLTVEISDAKFELLENYSGENSGWSKEAGGLDCAVNFPSGDLTALGGKTVRLKINFTRDDDHDPRLFAVALRTK